MAEGTQNPTAKGTYTEAESETDRTLPLLRSDLQHMMLFKWLNRRSHKGSYTWEQFHMMQTYYPIA